MALSRKHKILMMVAGLGASVVAADRLFFAPGAASADLASPPGADTPDNHKQSKVVAPKSSTLAHAAWARDASLAARLESLVSEAPAGSEFVRDVFWPQWASESPPPLPDPVVKSENQVVQRFVRDHKLAAVMGSGTSGYAVVDGKVVRIGGEIDGFKLISVNALSARFIRDEITVDLTVDVDPKKE